ncbi:hypothetical protein L1S35_12985 [Flavobacterium sp. AS60]|uniref:hypothetical protein n=1 Tax=Flavobacterium anseongense TaxID=2910677 RepID=UPI001F19D8ED|nr:hypothetical protein [Flavobacterium sp. AS60]MCF6130592.1 hypothetical protein [Flavobacterium sp. AS60]
MNVKNFFIGGIVGGIVDFLMGWLIWGILLKDTFPKPEGAGPENMLFIFLGCMCFGFMLSYIFAQGEGVSQWMAGIKLAIGIALFMSLANNFFYSMYKDTMDVKLVAIDVVASIVVSAVVGAAIAFTNGKMK